jgi:hypothetical protein
MPVKHEMHSISPPEFTTLTHHNPLVERFLRWPMVVLLMIGGKCSLFASKPAHISGHLPVTAAMRSRRAPSPSPSPRRPSPSSSPPPVPHADGRTRATWPRAAASGCKNCSGTPHHHRRARKSCGVTVAFTAFALVEACRPRSEPPPWRPAPRACPPPQDADGPGPPAADARRGGD